MKIFVLIVFILMYASIIVFNKYKVYASLAAAVITSVALLISKHLTFLGMLAEIDFNVILMLLGIMLTVGVFSESGMPSKIADKIMSKIPSALVAIVLLSVISGIISAFVDNVATVLMLAPIGLAVAKKAEVSPIPVIISIAVSSNLQGAATLVGDTTSIMLGSFADMNFFEFFFLDGKLSIFWAVELGALITTPILFFLFRKDNKKIKIASENIQVKTLVPTILLCLNMGLLVLSSFLTDKIAFLAPIAPMINGIICILFGIISIVFYFAKFKEPFVSTCKKLIDFETILFLLFLFIVIIAVETVGIIDDISQMFISLGNKNVFLLYTVIVFASVVISAFIDNIPYVATMLPVVSGLALGLPNVSPYLLYFGLLCGATLGGNLTPIGASANVVGIGILRKEGYNVKFSDFFKIGIPFTLAAVLSGYLLIWFVWA